MSIWDTLFNSSKTVEKATDAIISTGDKLFYTEEEKAEDRQRQREFFPTLLNAYAPFKIAQRILAIWFSFLFGLAFIIGLGITVFNMITVYNLSKVGKIASEITIVELTPLYNLVEVFDIGIIMLAIVSFYFAGGTIESFRKPK